jgi:hypothetical protein
MFPEEIFTKIFAYRREFWLATHRASMGKTLEAIRARREPPPLLARFKEEYMDDYPFDSYRHWYFE